MKCTDITENQISTLPLELWSCKCLNFQLVHFPGITVPFWPWPVKNTRSSVVPA